MTTPLIRSVKAPSNSHPLHRLLHSPAALVGAAWLLFVVVASLTAPLWTPYPPNEQDFTVILTTPSLAHWLGTDELGRDILSRLFTAGADALTVAAVAAAVPLIIAVPLALWSASAGRRQETVINRITEAVMAIPGVILILALVGVLGPNLMLVMAIFGILVAAGLYRVFLGQAKSLQSQLYVDAAQVDGSSPVGTSLRHVLPGLTNTIGVQFALLFAVSLLVQAGLAFLGFGPKIPAPSWGGMIQTASQHVYDAPWLMVPTGLILVFTVLAANAVGDVLSQSPDAPKLQIVLGPAARGAKKSGVGVPEVLAAMPVADAASGLIVSNLSLALEDGTTLVSNVSFNVAAGRVLGLVGESGCGKTLTALSLMGLVPSGIAPSGGTIAWKNIQISGVSERELAGVRGRRVAFISQEPMRALDPMFTIGNQLVSTISRLQQCSRAAAKAEATALLNSVGIVDVPRILRAYPHQISGGMAQRVAIALALAGKPELLVADEPTTALDVTVQAEILDVLRTLIAERGMSMVIVTHDLGVVADICDEVAVMYAGQIVETGSVTAVLDSPEHPYTMALLAADPHTVEGVVDRERLASIPGLVPPPQDWPSGCRFAPRCLFSTAACALPVPLSPRASTTGEVRCVRAKELVLSGTTWATEDELITSAPEFLKEMS
ncbi:dipeptide/oligopeptide/nickel ABC transporter permease/ATP-binding protein [Microbacterium deminutum]|uniref:Dipeptide/oligopeptide/nickel ABC transporter permease/ATP-binding protein n=1 Tax=Microbacterium deminutum TaxID=344164 RepID=A0ABN2R6A6_9MICO